MGRRSVVCGVLRFSSFFLNKKVQFSLLPQTAPLTDSTDRPRRMDERFFVRTLFNSCFRPSMLKGSFSRTRQEYGRFADAVDDLQATHSAT